MSSNGECIDTIEATTEGLLRKFECFIKLLIDSVEGGITVASSLPTANVSQLGKLYQINVTGSDDAIYSCFETSIGTYEWRQMFATDSAILRSPNGTLWALDITNDGRLTTNRVV